MTLNGATKRRRQQAIRELIARRPVASQTELARMLAARGIPATQATVSRDVAEMNLVRVARNGRQAWVSPVDLAPPSSAGDERLRRILTDIPVTVGRSGLILVLTGTPGTAGAIAQAIDESTLSEQEGTLAGDNTLLVLFADERRLERWRERFREIQGLAAGPAGSTPSPTHASSPTR
ncbi:MAG: arginine repressor [Chloroflexota bacterium]|nr:arginine repressor [Chloroflexota bacterium]